MKLRPIYRNQIQAVLRSDTQVLKLFRVLVDVYGDISVFKDTFVARNILIDRCIRGEANTRR